MAAFKHSVKILEVDSIRPSSSSSVTESSFPLTFFDLFWFRFHPVERVFFYSLPEADDYDSYFFDFVVPKLKDSLSVTLQYFLPLAGNIIWPQESEKPFIKHNPENGVLFTVAQSQADFKNISNYHCYEASESRALVPHLHISETSASILALQATLFPKRGFSVGITTNHAILDGKSSTMFMKAWAYFCKESRESNKSSSLPKELRPCIDRSVIKDPKGLDVKYLNSWAQIFIAAGSDVNTADRSVQILAGNAGTGNHELVQTTFTLNREGIENLRKRVLSVWDKVSKEEKNTGKPVKLSTFVLTCAHVLVCIVKAIRLEQSRKIIFVFAADCRERLEPPIDPNYLGNCVAACMPILDREEICSDDGVAFVSKIIYEEIESLKKDPLGRMEHALEFLNSMTLSGHRIIGLAGSPRFWVYETDFGWGKPDKVEIPSVGTFGSIAFAESKDGNGVEVGLVYPKHEMDIIAAAFYKGLQA